MSITQIIGLVCIVSAVCAACVVLAIAQWQIIWQIDRDEDWDMTGKGLRR